MRSRLRRHQVAVVAAGLVMLAVVGTAVGWRQLEPISAANVSYLSQEGYHENLLLDTYDTISSIGFFRSTAARLTRGLTSDSARLTALMLWTNENVRPQYAAPGRVVSDNAWELVRRGFGQCDQVNHILATLATYAGYDARQLFLWKTPQHLVSPHSVAEVYVKNRWAVVDAWQGVIWEDSNGSFLSADDATPALMDRFGYSQWGMQADWFKNGTEFRTFPYETDVAFVEKLLKKFSKTPAGPPVITPIKPVPRTTPGPSISPTPGQTPAPAQQFDAGLLVAYDRARRAQLDGDYSGAAAIYRSLLAGPLPPELSDESGFWLGMALYRSGKFEVAVEAFSMALARNPSTPWGASIHQYRAEALEMLSDRAGAISDYTSSNTPASRTRLTELGVEPPPITATS